MKNIDILYTRKKTIYNNLSVRTWGMAEDARNWKGGNSVIAHPPCRAWGKLKHLAKPRKDEKALAIHAVIMIRLYGGILEHPAESSLWKLMNLPRPGQKDSWGWTLSIDQQWFGHRAEKKTWLYIVGIEPGRIPIYPIQLKQRGRTVESMGKAERERTPEKLAIWLIKTVELINKIYNGTHRLSM